LSAIAAEAVTDGTFEAPINFPLDDIGKKVKGSEAHIWTSVPEQETEGTTSNGRDKPRVDLPLISYVSKIQPQGRFDVLQQYEGVVLSADSETFWARLNNNTSPDADEEEGEFPLEEVSKDDQWLVKPGAIFYWYIGYYDSASGQRTRQSVIRFRRLPAFTPEDLKHAREKAKKLMETFRLAEEDDELGEE